MFRCFVRPLALAVALACASAAAGCGSGSVGTAGIPSRPAPSASPSGGPSSPPSGQPSSSPSAAPSAGPSGSPAPLSVATAYPLTDPKTHAVDGWEDGGGNLWLSDPGTNAIIRITEATGATTRYPIPTANAAPRGIVVNTAGTVWFAETGAAKIGRIAGGTVTETAIPNAYHVGGLIPAGGGVFFTAWGGTPQVGYLASDGSLTLHTSGLLPADRLDTLAEGGDGNLWFEIINASATINGTNPSRFGLGRLTADGTITFFPIFSNTSSSSLTGYMTVGADGNIWFTQRNPNAIAKFDVTSQQITTYPVPSNAQPQQIVAPAGSVTLVFIEALTQTVGLATLQGAITEIPIAQWNRPSSRARAASARRVRDSVIPDCDVLDGLFAPPKHFMNAIDTIPADAWQPGPHEKYDQYDAHFLDSPESRCAYYQVVIRMLLAQ